MATGPSAAAEPIVEAPSPRSSRREQTAARLLRSSHKLSFDPMVEVPWDQPIQPGLRFAPVGRTSLEGTAMWHAMTPQQRLDAQRHEVASIAAAGIWFEVVLMRLLLRHAYWLDPTRRHTQYALTETGDECRHTVMFGHLIEWLEAPVYGPRKVAKHLGNVFCSPLSNHALAYAGALYVEDYLDRLQREAMADEGIQPVVRAVSRIHVIEESRHMSFARDELPRQLEGMSRADLARTRALLPVLVAVVTDALVHPGVYASVGVDAGEARRQAAANPNWRETRRWAASGSIGYFRELGLLDGPTNVLWRRTGVL